jgi:hypothetical protein
MLTSAQRTVRFLIARLLRAWTSPHGGPLGRFRRRAAIVSTALGLSLFVLVPPKAMIQTTASLCTLRPLQPWLGDTCSAMGVPGVVDRKERLAWIAALKAGDCASMRQFVRDFSEGANVGEADKRIARETRELSTTWGARDERMRHGYVSTGKGFPTSDLAREDAAARASQDAMSACLPTSERRRTIGAAVSNARPADCYVVDDEHFCALEFEVVCRVETREFVNTCR